MECNGCGANHWTFLGVLVLGREWYRCRDCGWDQTSTHEPVRSDLDDDLDNGSGVDELNGRGFIYG